MTELSDHKPSPIKGGVQMVQPYKVRGWAFCPATPDEHLAIDVRLDGAVVAQGTADVLLKDLKQKEIGQGDHGFVINMNVELPVAELARIKVTARSQDGLVRPLHIRDPAKRAAVGAAAASEGADAAPAGAPLADGVANGAIAPPRAAITPLYPFTPVDHAHRPVFVIGSARSGTTAMGQALLAIDRYSGFGEGHLLELAGVLDTAITSHYARNTRNAAAGMKTLIATIPPAALQAALQHGFVEIIRATYPSGYWIDKTPGPDMIRAAPLLHRIWPRGRFIFMKRRPVENIESRRRKFPQISFTEHCQLWADSMMAWDRVRTELAPVSLEVDQMTLATDPQGVADQVTVLLDLTPRDRTQLLASFQMDQPQRTSAAFAPVYDIDALGWDETQREEFQKICGRAMRKFGYSVQAGAR